MADDVCGDVGWGWNPMQRIQGMFTTAPAEEGKSILSPVQASENLPSPLTVHRRIFRPGSKCTVAFIGRVHRRTSCTVAERCGVGGGVVHLERCSSRRRRPLLARKWTSTLC